MKKLFLGIVCFCSVCNFAFSQMAVNGRLSIAVSFNAIAELTSAIVGDRADVSLIIPEGMEPHEAEPTPKNIAFLSRADVLVYNGFGMEFYLEKTLAAAGNKGLKLVEASKGIKPIRLNHVHDDEDEHEVSHHHHGTIDPHSWLSPFSAKIMIKNIAYELSVVDRKNAKFYAKNANSYTKKLDIIIKNYKKKFVSLKNKNIVASHAAFGYLCRDFSLVQSSIKDVFAEGEPNAKELISLVEYCRKNDIKTIFSEETASTALADTLSKEIGGKVVKIYTMETSEDGMSYIARMEENLKRIYENL